VVAWHYLPSAATHQPPQLPSVAGASRGPLTSRPPANAALPHLNSRKTLAACRPAPLEDDTTQACVASHAPAFLDHQLRDAAPFPFVVPTSRVRSPPEPQRQPWEGCSSDWVWPSLVTQEPWPRPWRTSATRGKCCTPEREPWRGDGPHLGQVPSLPWPAASRLRPYDVLTGTFCPISDVVQLLYFQYVLVIFLMLFSCCTFSMYLWYFWCCSVVVRLDHCLQTFFGQYSRVGSWLVFFSIWASYRTNSYCFSLNTITGSTPNWFILLQPQYNYWKY
jgi:hypothetical protein